MGQPEVVLISGCASGIGKALARDLHARRFSGSPAFKVYATDYRIEPLQELLAEGIAILELDVTSAASIETAVQKVLAENGRIDALVCNAGLSGRGYLAEMDYGIVEHTFAVNVHGTFRLAQAVAPHMMARRTGKIATVCSVNSYLAHPFLAPYVGSKAAVLNMTEALAMELNPFGISVTSIVPAYVKSNIIQNSLTERDRYAEDESPYKQYFPALQYMKKTTQDKGISPELAAKHIGDGLSKQKPPRFLYTGAEYRKALLLAFIQHWISNSLMARYLVYMFGLSTRYVPHNTINTGGQLQKAE